MLFIRYRMRPKHLSFKRAVDLCLNNQSLLGLAFSPIDPSAGKIRHVLVAPYNRILQWQFLNDVFEGADPDAALGICRDGKYEVVLVSNKYKPGDTAHRPKALSAYLDEKLRLESASANSDGSAANGLRIPSGANAAAPAVSSKSPEGS